MGVFPLSRLANKNVLLPDPCAYPFHKTSGHIVMNRQTTDRLKLLALREPNPHPDEMRDIGNRAIALVINYPVGTGPILVLTGTGDEGTRWVLRSIPCNYLGR